MKKYLLLTCLAFMLCACGANKEIFNLEKEGVAYNYNEKIFFYYPRKWDLKPDNVKLSLDILNPEETEGLYFDTFEVDASNQPLELVHLYVSKLEKLGIVVENQEEKQLQSLQPCYYITGHHPKNDMCFSEVVIFLDGRQYIYSYIAKCDIYEKNAKTMLLYLESLVVNDIQKNAV